MAHVKGTHTNFWKNPGEHQYIILDSYDKTLVLVSFSEIAHRISAITTDVSTGYVRKTLEITDLPVLFAAARELYERKERNDHILNQPSHSEDHQKQTQGLG